VPRTKSRAGHYEIDGRAPGRVVEPADDEETAAILRAADAAGDAVVAVGGGTLLGIGNPPRHYEIALSTARLDKVHEYDYRDLTIGTGAGITVAQLSALLAKQRQFVPLDVPQAAHATIGGTLAAGWLGPRRATHGRPRDLLIGTTTALADGTLAHAGGMVVKNVSGYDLSRL